MFQGRGLLQGPTGGRVIMSEVPLRPCTGVDRTQGPLPSNKHGSKSNESHFN